MLSMQRPGTVLGHETRQQQSDRVGRAPGNGQWKGAAASSDMPVPADLPAATRVPDGPDFTASVPTN